MKVYLCGPINGCTDEECRDWRKFAKSLLDDTLDPMSRDYRGRELEAGVATEIVENDKADIDACDALLVMYEKPSVGTAMEILYGWERGKKIVLVHPTATVLSPWLLYHCPHRVNSVREACAALNAQ